MDREYGDVGLRTGRMRTWRWLAAAGFMIVLIAVTYGSLEPKLAPPGRYGLDRFIHAGAYGLMSLLGCFAVLQGRAVVWVCVGLAAHGGLMEAIQSMIPGRAGSGWDLMADLVGILLGVALEMRLLRRVDGRVGGKPAESRA